MKYRKSFFIILSLFILASCNNKVVENNDVYSHYFVERVIDEGSCLKKEQIEIYCEKCGEIKEIKEGEYKDHKIKEEYLKNNEFNDNNHFILQSECEVCHQVFKEENIKFTDHHFLKIEESCSDDYKRYKSIYECLVCNEKIEYHFNLTDFVYGFNYDNPSTLILAEYHGKENNLYIPEQLFIENKEVKNVELSIDLFKDNVYLEKIKFSSLVSYIHPLAINNLANLNFIDMKKANVYGIKGRIFLNCNKLSEIIFPDKLLYYIDGIANINSLKVLDFSNTDLEYLIDKGNDVNDTIIDNLEKIIVPSTFKAYRFHTDHINLKTFSIDSNCEFGPLFIAYQPNEFYYDDWILKIQEFKKREEFNIDVSLVFPNGKRETLRLPYGINLFSNKEFIDLVNQYLKENPSVYKLGWYIDDKCFDTFLGILPKKDIVLYSLNLDSMDEAFLNKRMFLYSIYEDNNFKFNDKGEVIIESLKDFIALKYYATSNDVYEIKVELKNELKHYFMYFWCLAYYYNSYYLTSGHININNNKATITFDKYDDIRENEFELDKVRQNIEFDYRKAFKDFDFKENKRSENFDDFKYKNYSYIKEGVTDPAIMSHMLSVGINVIPKEGSLAEKTLNIYKDIARNIFNDNMSDYEKIVACNQYYNSFYLVGDENAAYSLTNNFYYSNQVEEIPNYGTINCGSSVTFTRLLYALEGIQTFEQIKCNHRYGVIKFENKRYISDHTLNYPIYNDNKFYNPLRGYNDCDFIGYDLNLPSNDPFITNYIKILRGVALSYPGIDLEEFHYSSNN